MDDNVATPSADLPPDKVSRFDAFISYSHPDRDVATKLQRRIEQLARPWFRRRSLRVFIAATRVRPTRIAGC